MKFKHHTETPSYERWRRRATQVYMVFSLVTRSLHPVRLLWPPILLLSIAGGRGWLGDAARDRYVSPPAELRAVGRSIYVRLLKSVNALATALAETEWAAIVYERS